MIRFLFSLCSALILLSCATTKKVEKRQVRNQSAEEEAFLVTAQDSAEARALFLQGVDDFELGDNESALDNFTQAMIKLPHSSGIQYALADAYLSNDDPSNAIYYANQAARLEPSNFWYRMKVVEIYEQMSNYDAAIENLRDYISQNEVSIELRYKLAELYTQNNEREKSNQVYADIIKRYGPDGASYYRRYINFLALDKKEAALTELEELIKLNQDDSRIKYTLVELQIETGHRNDAKKTLSDLLQNNPGDTQAYRLLVKLNIEDKMWGDIFGLISDIMSNSELDYKSKEQFVGYLYSQGDSIPNADHEVWSRLVANAALTVTKNYPTEPRAFLFLGGIYAKKNLPILAEEAYKKTLDLDPDNQNAWLELVQLWLRQNEFTKITANEADLDNAVPENAFIEYALGVSYFSLRNYAKSVSWLKRASFTPARAEFKSAVQTILGDAYQELKNWPAASEAYDAAIKYDPQNATALNNYAYYLSVRGEKLNEAKLMSKKSLDIEPDNPSFLDTYGWILYQNELYDEARIYILKALEKGKPSAEMFEHLGDVYEKLNKRDEAINWWKKALEIDANRQYLKEKIGQ